MIDVEIVIICGISKIVSLGQITSKLLYPNVDR